MLQETASLQYVYDVARVSPLQKATRLSHELQATIYLKREDTQSVHSFKLRGAYNKIYQLTNREKAQGIIAVSAGNHAQGVALAAQKLGLSALIVMPRTTPQIKVDAVKSLGATIELVGSTFNDAFEHCKKRIIETKRTFIHPFDDPLVIAGQGTIGTELLEQQPALTHIFVPVGGGGLLAGVAQAVKKACPHVQIIGVEPEDSNCMQAAIQAGELIALKEVGAFADGVAVKQAGEYSFAIARELVDDFITVSTDQICTGIKTIFQETRSIVEPAGALAVAGVSQYAKKHNVKNTRIAAICSGANMPFEKLSFVTERTTPSARERMSVV